VTVRGTGGTPVRLRLVGILRDSMLQGELIVADTQFLRVFPEVEGFRFFLLEAPGAAAASLTGSLQDRLADWGFAVERSSEVLAAYHRVENTYLSTFQSLGALGLLLGTIGLAVVLLRNVLERRQQLALLRAVGYRRSDLARIIVSENAILMTVGLACGSVAALIAAAPALHSRGGGLPLTMVLLLLAAVLVVGLFASILAVAAALRTPLIAALRSE
jgi:putative ABC transport system permease protein